MRAKYTWIAMFVVTLTVGARAADLSPATEAFHQTLVPLQGEALKRFTHGQLLFDSDWSIAPGPRKDLDGLGPLFSRLSCDGCHTRAGRGEPPRDPKFPMISMVVRLSVPGTGPEGGPKPHPVYGDQLDRNAVAGVPIEGRAFVSYTEVPGQYADGEPYSLRVPHYRFTDLGYGPLGSSTLFSARVAPILAGLGLVDAVPDDAILAIATEEAREGRVHGRPNFVWDVAAKKRRVGRFGWKAGQPSLRQQNANAFNRDIGITSTLYPENDCTSAETICVEVAAATPRRPKIDDELLGVATFFVASLAPPRPLHVGDPVAREGAKLFASAGCAACHRPTLKTGPNATAEFANKTFHPYSDLLLHDMGEGLADGRPEFDADGRSWRTPPLWGLGHIMVVNNHQFLLHDGRARGPAEAILWHGGEAEGAKEVFRRMSKAERAALIAFLEQL